MDALQHLQTLKDLAGPRQTQGLPATIIREFLITDALLQEAIEQAHQIGTKLHREYPELTHLSEEALIHQLQEGFVNFYALNQRNPYVAIAARGPWIITLHGAVIHDSGGYGMLGFGHAPKPILEAMNQPCVMANIMTASFSQHQFYRKITQEIGHQRAQCPYDRFICMNSGSEAMTVAARLSDMQARKLTDSGGRFAGRKLMYLSMKGGFHGRTEKPAIISDSSYKTYAASLASFRQLNVNYTIEPNNIEALEQAFEFAENEGIFFESMYLEPVMGEGNPGLSITPEFYQKARELTRNMGTLLVVDSIQAGIRAHGCLSICDYPGFERVEAPDMESFSKALNAGQFPFSVLALTQKVADLYKPGIYGNTKTSNPRALNVACAVLDEITPELRSNVQHRGQEFKEKCLQLQHMFPQIITQVQGTGLLCAISIDPERYQVVGKGQLEEQLRKKGIGVIHGGANALRFTPHFRITSAEIDLIMTSLQEVLSEPAVSACH